MKYLILLSCCIAFFFSVNAQKFNLDSIHLSWDDFSVVGDSSTFYPHSAYIYTYLPYKWRMKQNDTVTSIVFQSEVRVVKEKSWVRKAFLDTATNIKAQELLDHEKGHLIIALIYHKKLLVALTEYPFTRKRKKEIKRIYRNILKSLSEANEMYDRETSHMANEEQQRIWINKLLEEFNSLHKNDKRIFLSSEIEIVLSTTKKT